MSEIRLIVPTWDAPTEIVAAVSTRIGGVSQDPYDSFNLAHHVGDASADVDENLRILADNYPQRLHWQWLQQIHSSEVCPLARQCAPGLADALTTRVPDLACCLLTADCLPVFFAARDGSEVAMAHAGWRGLASGILENTMASCITPARDMMVWLGPAIGACHFEVGAEVKTAFLASASNSKEKRALTKYFAPISEAGQYLADLAGIARLKLAQLGVVRVYGGELCTFCEPDLFYSFRRDGTTGRMASFIYIASK